MRLAHLVLTHANPTHLQRMVTRLWHKDADFYIHVDAKSAITPFLPIADKGNVYFIKDRVKVSWGGYSIVQATINGFEQILASGKQYDYINLLSGQDYPIKSTAYIHQFLAENPGRIFMQFQSIMNDWKEAIPRITQYHLTHYNFKGHVRAEQLINAILPQRKLPVGIVAVGRSQWFTATPQSIAWMLAYIRKERWVARFFKLSWAPDEMIFQTLLYNSPFKNEMINDNLVYLDWSAGKPNPKVLTMEDAEALKKSNKLFARKFDPGKDSEILDFLDDIATS